MFLPLYYLLEGEGMPCGGSLHNLKTDLAAAHQFNLHIWPAEMGIATPCIQAMLLIGQAIPSYRIGVIRALCLALKPAA